MKTALKLIATGLVLAVLIIVISNFSKAYITIVPDELKLYLWPDHTLEQVTSGLPEVKIHSKEDNIVRVPYGKLNEYSQKLKKVEGISYVATTTVAPTFSYRILGLAVKKQLFEYLDGNFGSVRLGVKTPPKPILEYLQTIGPRTLKYLIPGLLLSIVIGLVFSVTASLNRRLGQLFDSVQVVLLSIPDFVLVTLLQLLSIYYVRATGSQLMLVAQAGASVPFTIPLLAIAIVPGVVIYGTLRIAIQRELQEGYVRTAYAKGFSLFQILLRHVLRNVMADLLTVLSRATMLAITSMVVAEVVCKIAGIGGYMVNPNVVNEGALPFTSMILVLLALIMHGVFTLLGKWLVVRTKEVG